MEVECCWALDGVEGDGWVGDVDAFGLDGGVEYEVSAMTLSDSRCIQGCVRS